MAGRIVAVVCTGALLLSACGLVEDRNAAGTRGPNEQALGESSTSRDLLGTSVEDGGGTSTTPSTTRAPSRSSTTSTSPSTTTTTTAPPKDPPAGDDAALVEALNAGATLCDAFQELVTTGYDLFNSPANLASESYAAMVADLVDATRRTAILAPEEAKAGLSALASEYGALERDVRASASFAATKQIAATFLRSQGPAIDAAIAPISTSCPTRPGNWAQHAPANWWATAIDGTPG